MSQSYLRSIYLRLAGVVMLVVMLALAASAYLSHRAFEAALAPEMAKKVASGGASARSLVLKAMEHHISFREIYGIEQTFDELKRSIPDVAYVAVTDTQGTVLYQRFTAPAGAEAHFRSPAVIAGLATPSVLPPSLRVGNQYVVSMPIVTPQQPVGMMHIGVSVDFVDRIILDMLFDVLVVLVVALFFTLELLNFMAGSKLEASLKSLGDTIERGASGDFTPIRSRGPAGPRALASTPASRCWRATSSTAGVCRRMSVHPGWRQRTAGCKRCRNVSALAAPTRRPAATTANWPRSAHRCSSSSWPKS
jgi:hypothetical protein